MAGERVEGGAEGRERQLGLGFRLQLEDAL